MEYRPSFWILQFQVDRIHAYVVAGNFLSNGSGDFVVGSGIGGMAF